MATKKAPKTVYRTRYVKKPSRRKKNFSITRTADKITDGAVALAGMGAVLNAIDEGTLGTGRITTAIAEKKNPVPYMKDSVNALKRGDFWIGVVAYPVYRFVKRLIRKVI